MKVRLKEAKMHNNTGDIAAKLREFYKKAKYNKLRRFVTSEKYSITEADINLELIPDSQHQGISTGMPGNDSNDAKIPPITMRRVLN